MRQSKLFNKTRKTVSKDAEIISHKYLLKGDFIEQSSSGVYRFLPLGFKVFKKIEEIIRQEMLDLGAQELQLPVLQNKNLWLETGRWKTIDPPLFKFKNRHQKEIALGPTHEEEITDIVRQRVKSYQDLPLFLFQIQNKFRNEMRSTGGLLRTIEFLMKDLYSFHATEKDLAEFYQKTKNSYLKIFRKCGLKSFCVEAVSGTIGGELCHEFMVESMAGEDKILVCRTCGFGANIEKAGELKNCPKCGLKLERKTCVEVGHIFNLGTKYSSSMKANFTDKEGKFCPVIMGCYGIGVSRLMAVIVEANHDEKGIIWPKEVSPYQIHLIALSIDSQKIKKEAEKIYSDFQKKGLEILYDDRNKSAGEKFADSDLLGIPTRIVISEKTLEKNSVEVKERNKKELKIVKLKDLLKIKNN